MAFEVKWTPSARDNYREIVSFLFDEWGEASAEKFTDELQSRLHILERFPYLGKQHPKILSVRQLVISKRHILFYTVVEEIIVVLNVIDSKYN